MSCQLRPPTKGGRSVSVEPRGNEATEKAGRDRDESDLTGGLRELS